MFNLFRTFRKNAFFHLRNLVLKIKQNPYQSFLGKLFISFDWLCLGIKLVYPNMKKIDIIERSLFIYDGKNLHTYMWMVFGGSLTGMGGQKTLIV